MKIIKLILLLSVFFNNGMGQNKSISCLSSEKYFSNPIQYLSGLDEKKILTKILIDRYPYNESVLMYNGFNKVKTCSKNEWEGLYQTIKKSLLFDNYFMNYDTLVNIYNKYINASDIYPIVGLNYEFNKILEESINNGDFKESTDCLIEKKSNYSSYSTHRIIAASVLRKYIYGDIINFVLPRGLWFSFQDNISALEIDFGNGNGYTNVYFDNPIAVEYNSNNEDVLVKLRIIFEENSVNEADTLYTHFTFFRKGTSCVPEASSIQSSSLLKEHPNFLKNEKIMYYPSELVENNSYSYSVNNCIMRCVRTPRGDCDLQEVYCPETERFTEYYVRDIQHTGYPIEYCFYFNPSNTSGKLRRPLIVCDGFDPGDTKNYHSNNSEIDPRGMYEILNGDPSPNEEKVNGKVRPSANLVSKLQDLGYDIVFVNFLEGAGDIPSNAETLRKFLNTIINGKYRDEQTEEIVLVGPSMGGLITRYALAKMEQEQEEHYVRQWISFDSPQKGANVAIGLQYILFYLSKMHTGGLEKLENAVNDFKSNIDILNTPAAQQMILQHYSNFGSEAHAKSNFQLDDNNTIGSHAKFKKFYDELEALNNNKGYPSLPKTYAVSNGGTSKRWTEEGAQIVKFKVTNWTYVRAYANHNTAGAHEVFWGKRQDTFLDGERNDNDYSLYTSGQIGYENSPGGGYAMTGIMNKNKSNLALDYFDEELPQYTAFTFMPTTTTFGIQVTRDNVYKTWKYYKDNNIKTPFDELFGMDENEDHVQITENTANDKIINDILLDDFMNQVKPYNRNGEQNMQTVSSTVTYKVGQTIQFAGYNNSFVIRNSGEVSIKAGKRITFSPGFKVENGATLSTEITPISLNTSSLLKYESIHRESLDYTQSLLYEDDIYSYKTKKNEQQQIEEGTECIHVFPTICTDIVKIAFSSSKLNPDENYEYVIFNVHGQILQSGTSNMTMNDISLSHYSSGAYWIKIKTSKNMYIHEFFKK